MFNSRAFSCLPLIPLSQQILRPAICAIRRPLGFRYPPYTTPPRRALHLAPPFLLEDYTPRYMALSAVDTAKKRSAAYAHLRNCNLCPRLCGVNRYETTGMCLIGEKAKVNVIAPHFGEGSYHFSSHQSPSLLLLIITGREIMWLIPPALLRTMYPRPPWKRHGIL